MTEFGKTLRQRREEKGLTVSEVAKMTHMMSQVVEGLENEDFRRIVAPIYGRGFVKLYCEVLGLEPQPMIDKFMTLYNGTGAPGAEPAAPAAPACDPSVPAAVPAAPKPATVAAAAEPSSGIGFGEAIDDRTRRPLRFPPVLRIALLAAIAGLIVWLIVIGLRALFCAPTAENAAPAQRTDGAASKAPAVAASKAPAVAPSKAPAVAPASKSQSRKPLPVPPLYMD